MKSLGIGIALAFVLGTTSAHAQEKQEKREKQEKQERQERQEKHESEAHEKAERAELEKNAPALSAALKGSKISLESGLKASESEGTPISAKFQVDSGKPKLFVFTMKGEQFFKVEVDDQGNVAKTEPITSGGDLTEAKEQGEAMKKSKRTLQEVVAQAEKKHAGFTAVGVEAELERGAAHADVSLVKGTKAKAVEEKL